MTQTSELSPLPGVAELAAMLRRGDATEAEAGLAANLCRNPPDGRAANYLVSHLIRTQRPTEALHRARMFLAATESKPDAKNHPARLLLGEALLAAGELDEAREIAPAAGALGNSWQLQLRRAKLMIGLGCMAEARTSCTIARSALPAHPTAAQVIRLGRLANQAGDAGLTVDCIADALQSGLAEGGMSDRQRTALLNLRVESLLAVGRHADAYELLEQASAAGDNEQIAAKALWVARYHGDAEMLARARDRQRMRGRQRLPSDLARGLADIETGPVPDRASAPNDMSIAWAAAGRNESEWPDWASRYLWGARASALLVDWLQFAGDDRQDELAALVVRGDDVALRAALSQARGVILAGTHLGPVAATFPYLLSLPAGLAVVGGGKTEIGGVEGIFVPQRGRAGTIRAVRQQLQQRGIAGITIDMVADGEGRSIGLGGRHVLFSTLVPRLSRALSVPTIWVQPEWRDGRVSLRIKALPDPIEGEDKQGWEARWFAAFAAHLTDFLRTCSPESASGLRVCEPESRKMQDGDPHGGGTESRDAKRLDEGLVPLA